MNDSSKQSAIGSTALDALAARITQAIQAALDAQYKRINADLHAMNDGLGKFIQDEIAEVAETQRKRVRTDLQRLSHAVGSVIRHELDARQPARFAPTSDPDKQA